MDQPKDVQIIPCHGRVRSFHSSVVASNSTLFAKYLTEGNAAKLAPSAKAKGVTVRWIIEKLDPQILKLGRNYVW